MLERGLQPDFSDAALKQLEAIAHAPPTDADSLRDLRRLLWASIDNDDSRDLDQLSVAEPLPGNAVKIFVAIADVDALVKRGSALDGHAQTNTTSVYTAAEIFPMLPSTADGTENSTATSAPCSDSSRSTSTRAVTLNPYSGAS